MRKAEGITGLCLELEEMMDKYRKDAEAIPSVYELRKAQETISQINDAGMPKIANNYLKMTGFLYDRRSNGLRHL